MHWIVRWTLLVCVFVMPARSQQLLKNRSFEEHDPVHLDQPRYWTPSASKYTPLQLTGEHYHGAASALLLGDSREHQWRQEILSPQIQAFTLSAFVKADDVSLADKADYAFVYGHLLYKNQPYSSATHFYIKIPAGTYDWKRFTVSVTANLDAPIEKILISIAGRSSRGKIFVDQVSVTPSEELAPESLLKRKVDDLSQHLARIGNVDATVVASQNHLAKASALLAKTPIDLAGATEQWITAAQALSHDAWVAMFPDAMSTKIVEARMLYHGIANTAEGCDHYVGILEKTGCNGVYHSLGSWMSVIYHSKLVPVSAGWETFDALKYSIDQSHRRGIKAFGYVAALYGTTTPAADAILLQKHPNWFAHGPDANMPVFPDPANPEVADFLVRLFTELAETYDLDAIGLDAIRYPTETALNYDENNRQQILQRYGIDIREGNVSGDPAKWAKIREYRAEKVTGIIRRVRDAVKKVRPSTSVIACLLSDPIEARECGQDWAVSAAMLDYGSPMNYDEVSADSSVLKQQLEIFRANRALYFPAIGGMPEVHQSWTLSTWAQRVALQRKIGADGIIIYRMGGFDPAVSAFFGNGPFHGKCTFPKPVQK